MSAITQERRDSLVAITSGKPEWYATRRKVTAAERLANVDWDGAAKKHVPRQPGKLVQSTSGTWARQHDGVASALTAGECVALKLAPGPGNQ